mmetsp:Transcript_42329/g.92041  ORF Transcript_42329/g.92041 Transcript_42329/m.92041 type:complete len:261 (+) Transcript_42329:2274-3056(+)
MTPPPIPRSQSSLPWLAICHTATPPVSIFAAFVSPSTPLLTAAPGTRSSASSPLVTWVTPETWRQSRSTLSRRTDSSVNRPSHPCAACRQPRQPTSLLSTSWWSLRRWSALPPSRLSSSAKSEARSGRRSPRASRMVARGSLPSRLWLPSDCAPAFGITTWTPSFSRLKPSPRLPTSRRSSMSPMTRMRFLLLDPSRALGCQLFAAMLKCPSFPRMPRPATLWIRSGVSRTAASRTRTRSNSNARSPSSLGRSSSRLVST